MSERVSCSIPSLINGVSQQAQAFRLSSQGGIQTNTLSSVLDGISKRPPTEHISKITDHKLDNVFIHIINRDSEERYVVLVYDGQLRVFDLENNGAEVQVNFPNGVKYLDSSTPMSTFRMTTVADYTFVVNRDIGVEMDSFESREEEENRAIAFIKKGVVNTTYKIMVDGEWFSHTTPSPSATVSSSSSSTVSNAEQTQSSTTNSGSTTTNNNTQPPTDDIADSLAASIRTGTTGFVVETVGSSILIYRSDNEDFTFAVTDSWGNEASMAIKREVQKFQDLPARAWDGFRVRIAGENPSRDDDYYLEYSSDSFYKNGVWKETRGWDQDNHLDASTMPHTLVREADGTFTFKRPSWKERKCGDDHSVPWPSFVGSKLEDVFFYRNRLGLIADENVILSGSGEYFNYWPDTATTVLATDPIDIAVTNDKVSLLRHASVFGESLVLFADQAQFQLGCGTQASLAPDTVRVDKTTEYNCSKLCKPVHSGQSLYFIAEQGDFSGLREYIVSPDAVTDEAPEVTSHVPRYLPKGMFRMAVAINDGILFGVARETPNVLYVYRYFWVGDEKVQSCWSKWVLPEECVILSLATIDSSLYLVVQYEDGVSLEKVDINARGEEEELGFKVLLDRKVRLIGSYIPAEDRTVWTLPYAVDASALVLLLARSNGTYPPAHILPNLENDSGASVSATGDFSSVPVIAGLNYEQRYRFSQQFVRESKEAGSPVIQAGRLQLLRFTLVYQNSGYFFTEIVSRGRRPKKYEHTGKIGSQDLKLDEPHIVSGIFRFPILARSDRVSIDIVNPSHFPSCISTAEWEGAYTVDAKRI